MIKTNLISFDTPSPHLLNDLKVELGLADNNFDNHLKTLLCRAMIAVQEDSDVSLLPSVYEVTDTQVEGCEVRLYQNVKAVESVIVDGLATADYRLVGNFLKIYQNVESCIVRYSTSVYPSDINRYKAVILRYARALFEGQSSKELNAILREC